MDLLATVIWIFLSSTHDPVIMATAVVTVHSDPQSWQFRIQRRHRSLAVQYSLALLLLLHTVRWWICRLSSISSKTTVFLSPSPIKSPSSGRMIACPEPWTCMFACFSCRSIELARRGARGGGVVQVFQCKCRCVSAGRQNARLRLFHMLALGTCVVPPGAVVHDWSFESTRDNQKKNYNISISISNLKCDMKIVQQVYAVVWQREYFIRIIHPYQDIAA